MEIQRIDGYTDPRFSQEVLRQHGAFLVDGAPWAFRVISDHEAVIDRERTDMAALAEAVEYFRFYAEHITTFYDGEGNCLLELPPVERREAEIDSLQPTQFSVDREKCGAVGHFLHTASDVAVPVMTLADGTLCVLDGHTRLYEARRRGILFNRSDGPADCDFFFPAVCEGEHLVAGLAGDGSDHRKTARMAAKIRKILKNDEDGI